jgi:hypothetical protein
MGQPWQQLLALAALAPLVVLVSVQALVLVSVEVAVALGACMRCLKPLHPSL